MLRSDCYHLRKVTHNDIHEGNKGSLRCDVHRAAPDPTSRAGISCPSDCMGYRAIGNGNGRDTTSALQAIKQAFLSLIGQK
jgi:hypothetical protein